MLNKNSYLVGKLKDYDYGKGWFFGQFAKNKLLKSDILEISFQKLNSIKPEQDSYPHYHKKAVEINIVIKGSCSFTLNNKEFKVNKGDFYVIYPKVNIDKFKYEKDTEVIVIKAPSVEKDKFISSKK